MSSFLTLSFLLAAACGPDSGLASDPSSENAPTQVVAPGSPSESPDANPDAIPDPNVDPSPDEEVDLNADAHLDLGTGAKDDAVLTTSTMALGQVQAQLTTLPAPTGLRTVAQWESLFLGRWSVEHTEYLTRSKSLDSWQFYNLGYGIDANTAMYRATGKTQYLDRALLYVNNVVANAKPSTQLGTRAFRDVYLGWTSQRSDTVGQEVPLFESYCWRYVTRMLRVIRETPELYNNATYRAQYDRLLAFTEKNVFEKWARRGANAYIYRSRTHMAAHWAYIAMDLSRMTTDATKKAAYLAVFNGVNRDLPNSTSSLRGQLRTSPVNAAAYFWSDVWGSTARPGQDVAHANGVVAYIVEARDAGMEWTDTDIRKFVVTLNSVIWPAAGRYANYVDGTTGGNGWFSDGLMKLGRYDVNLQRRIDAHTVGRGTPFYGNAALNVRLLSEAAAR